MSYALYVHIPFCLRKCNYCDFVSFSYKENIADEYLSAVDREMALYADKFNDHHLRTIFIGGGTPTCLSAEQINLLMKALHRYFSWDKATEFTIEANPGTLTNDKLNVLKDAGVNRFSIGAQSFNEQLLQRIGRIHNVDQIGQAVAMVRKAGFTNINLDLIFGLPDQSLTDWQNTLQQVVQLSPEHISAYGLKIEEGTPFALDQENGLLMPCDEELELAMYQQTREILQQAGYQQYEISNFAKPGKPSQHNLTYWHNEPYLGLGLAAHSFMTGQRWENYASIDQYNNALKQGLFPIANEEAIPLSEQIQDAIFLGLRLIAGINLTNFKTRYQVDLLEKYQQIIQKHQKNGLLNIEENNLKLTPKGLFLSNEVMVDFI